MFHHCMSVKKNLYIMSIWADNDSVPDWPSMDKEVITKI